MRTVLTESKQSVGDVTGGYYDVISPWEISTAYLGDFLPVLENLEQVEVYKGRETIKEIAYLKEYIKSDIILCISVQGGRILLCVFHCVYLT